jgi:hypothetical protein
MTSMTIIMVKKSGSGKKRNQQEITMPIDLVDQLSKYEGTLIDIRMPFVVNAIAEEFYQHR